MTTHLTAAMLRDLDACSDQVAIFDAAFPDGLTMPTDDGAIAALAAKVAALRLDVGWAAEALLSPVAYGAYDEATAPARLAYDEATAAALLRAGRDHGWRDFTTTTKE